jgi:minor extracellular serine protease Vpr
MAGTNRLIALSAAAVALGIGVPARAQVDARGRPERWEGERTLFARSLASQPLTVVLKLADDPVAVVRSRAPGKHLSDADREALEDGLRRQQDALVPTIETMGGEVLAKFQDAVNGIKVRATPDRLLALASLPGVVAVKPVLRHELMNAISVPFIGAPSAWGTGTGGFRGEGVKIAIIDTGVDYTHANFRGPGTPAAFLDAAAHSTEPANPALFGPAAPKVKGGTDLVGDDYNANPDSPTYQPVPHPDPNPLDCNSHGTHVSGTAAGFGVNADGTPYAGPYTASTPSNAFRIGPGVAPLADLYAVRVFGCEGSTDVVVEAIDWAVKHGMDVISMSLGADFGPADSADAEAATHAAEAGVIVVAAAGNAGGTVYFTGSPASADKVLSVAAMDSNSPASFPAANLTLDSGTVVKAQISNAAPSLPAGALAVFVMPVDGVDSSTGLPYSGCTEATWAANAASVAGRLVVTRRGVCARVDRATFGQKYGAAAVAMINNSSAFPAFEGPIPGVTIPFLGVRGPSRPDGAQLEAAASATLSPASPIANPAFHAFASFSSGGPRNLDSHLKPDLTAPGVNVVSSLIGTGTEGAAFSGTSMATPHVAGVAALALQAHRGWDPDEVRLAIVNTSDPSRVVDYAVRRGGAGLVQPFAATLTQVVAEGDEGAGSVSFGLEEFSSDLVRTRKIEVKNLGRKAQTFTAWPASPAGSPHAVTITPSTFTVRGGEKVTLRLQLSVPAATSGNTAGSAGVFRQVAGLVAITPTTATGNDGVALTVPYFLVPRARSEVRTSLPEGFGPSAPVAAATVRNGSPAVTGTADFYAWGLRGHQRRLGAAGLRAVGVQAFDLDSGAPCTTGSTCLLVFAVNVFGRWTTPVLNEYDILVDTDGDGTFDWAAAAQGLTSGRVAVFLYDLHTGLPASQSAVFLASAPTNESTILMPIVAGDLGIDASHPRFTYAAQAFDGFTANFDFVGETPAGAVAADAARFNAFSSAVSTGGFAVVPPLGTASVPLALDVAELAVTPPLGVMVVNLENASGRREATLLRLGDGEDDD